MHRRSHSGISTHSANIRSLMDSPGSDDSHSLSDGFEHESDADRPSPYLYHSQSEYEDESSCAFAHVEGIHHDGHDGHDEHVVTLPLHRQPNDNVTFLSNKQVQMQMQGRGHSDRVSNISVPQSVGSQNYNHHNQHQHQSHNGSQSHGRAPRLKQSKTQHYQKVIDKGLINMKNERQAQLQGQGQVQGRARSKSQKENKRPDQGQGLSRQSSFGSTSTSTYSQLSDFPEASVAASISASVLSARSVGVSSPARSRVSLMDIDELSRGSGSSISAAPLVLGGGGVGSGSVPPSNNDGKLQRHKDSNSNGNVNGNGNGNGNSLALILSNEMKKEEIKNPMLKNLLSNVQLPRPRLIPFSPMLGKEAPSSSSSSEGRTQGQSPSQAVTAASFAKQAPKAGYLKKLGTSVSEYKRRFFVLKPTTCLYYFLSPNDDEPRGCIDLDGFVDASDTSGMGGMKVNSLGTLPDGRFRFECVLPIQNHDGGKLQTRKILLEARNEEMGKEWMQALTVERLSYSKATGKLLEEQVKELESDNKSLEEQLEELRLVEKDRDGAVEDAQAWRERAENLDHALTLLKRWVSRCSDDSEKDRDGYSGADDSGEGALSLSISEDDKALDEIDVPGTTFSSLVNACRGMKENLRLTLVEASTALEDLKHSNQNAQASNEKVAKAEKYICKLWEENCAARESLRKRKNEKKILVNEVKVMIEKANESEKEIAALKREKQILEERYQILAAATENRRINASSIVALGNGRVDKKRQLKTPEKKLLLELEEHVNTSLYQHEYLLDTSTVIDSPPRVHTSSSNSDLCVQTIKKSNATEESFQKVTLPHKQFDARDGESSSKIVDSDDSTGTDAEQEVCPSSQSPLRPKNLSLMDQVAVEEDDEIQLENNLAAILHSPCSLSLTSANLEVFAEAHLESVKNVNANYDDNNDQQVQHKRNPLHLLDSDDSTIGPSDLSMKSLVTDNGRATSKLACPLKDVTQSTQGGDDGKVYSLTFYTQRIGLQFQKVPGTIVKNGLLTEAMTADLRTKQSGEGATTENRTEAELRLVASLSNSTTASKLKDPIKNHVCPVLFPKHNVLVCGFQGFENNRRPSLGARLVGFDGISIERGPWTFEAVRKAIKARSRPLTLTFRDDYLNTEQRTILTKAANEVELSSNQPPRPMMRHGNVPVTISAVTKVGMMKSPSFSDIDLQSHDDSTTLSNCSRSSDNWRTFSDAGSSVISSKLSPFMANIMAGIPTSNRTGEKREGSFTPEYFRRSNDSLDSSISHQEFKASLL